ncbi:MAG: glycosyltransferase [Lachnospiraceae bacterium]|nr:glycosyltransferase [Lachnospiraceae bacterium]
MSEKKVSVIVPCYNAENIIDRCLNSLVNQTLGLENMEIILVNDASTDGTLQVLKTWEEKYPDSILLIDSTVNMKTGGARNLGIQYASGEYIGFVDNDDWVDETMYEKAYSAAEKYDCDVVSVLYAREREDGYRFPFAMPTGEKNVLVDATKPVSEGISALPGEVWSKIYRKSMVMDNNLYFPEGLSYPENYWEPLVKYYMKSYYVVDEILYHYIQYEKSIILTGDMSNILDRLEIEKKLLQEIKERKLADINEPQIVRDFIQRYYVNTLYLSFARAQSAFPYEIYAQMKEYVLDIYPKYYENEGVIQLCKENASAFLLRTLEYEMSDELWDRVAEEYLSQKLDLSIFLSVKKEERVQGTIETREVFKLGYLFFSEMRNIVSDLRERLLSEQKKTVWDDYENMLQQCIEESNKIVDAIQSRYQLKEKFYQPDTLKQLWQESAVAFDREDTEKGLLLLQRYWQYLELPLDLCQVVWCKGDLTAFQYLPALEFCFLHADEQEYLEHARRIIFQKRSPMFSFPYEEEKYICELGYNDIYQMYGFVLEGVHLYFPKKSISDMAELERRTYGLLVEQDPRSPHRYLNERMDVQEGAIIIDAGVAEGNFAASVIHKCKKIYMVECDPDYIDALKHSFKDYLDKIVFVNKFLDSYDDDEHITIDTLLNGETINYIKMDIEGAEIAALQGAKQTLKNATDLKCNICSYHNLHDYDKIVEILSEYDMEIEHSPGYMFFVFDEEYPCYPRRGLVQAVKKV